MPVGNSATAGIDLWSPAQYFNLLSEIYTLESIPGPGKCTVSCSLLFWLSYSCPELDNVNIFDRWSLNVRNSCFSYVYFPGDVAWKVADGRFSIQDMYSKTSPTVMILSFRTDRSEQTVQTQIRLLLEEQSGQGLLCLPFHLHCLDSLLYGKATWFKF